MKMKTHHQSCYNLQLYALISPIKTGLFGLVFFGREEGGFSLTPLHISRKTNLVLL